MRLLVLACICALLSLKSNAQLNITQEIGGEQLNGTTYLVDGNPSIFEFEHPFYVTNSADEPLSVGCRRTELDVQTGVGIQSTLCWVICPAYVDAGSEPIRISPFSASIPAGGTDSSFVMHLRPNGVDGCTRYLIEWFDAEDDTEVFASIEMVFDHSAGSCLLSLNENEELVTKLSPNPSSEETVLNLSGVNSPVNVQIIDLLGKVRSTFPFNPVNGTSRIINTTGLSNGIYFVSISDNSGILKTIKMVVKK
jgi:hypothetical protein